MGRTKKGLLAKRKEQRIALTPTEPEKPFTQPAPEIEERPFIEVKAKTRRARGGLSGDMALGHMMNPQIGDRVVYVEFGMRKDGKPYRNDFMGVVSRIVRDEENENIFHFWAEFPAYKNHYYPKTPKPLPVVHDTGNGRILLYFDHDYLTPEDKVSTCYLDKFCKHITASNWKYLNEKIMGTYLVARSNEVVSDVWCIDGGECSNDTIGHLINFKHELN